MSAVPLQEKIREQLRRRWTVEVVGGDTELGFEDWLRGVGAPTPQLHTPPRMVDDNGLTDGMFRFYDVDNNHPDRQFRAEYVLDVVPMESGNVEIICGDTMFTLHHLDRADLIRALLHDFHYSPEKGGPNDDHV